MTSDVFRMPIRVVFYREEERTIAHCLELDLLGDGDTREEAIERLSQAIRIQVEASVEFGNPRNLFRPADSEIFQMYAAGRDIGKGNLEIEVKNIEVKNIEVDEYDAREYVAPNHDQDLVSA